MLRAPDPSRAVDLESLWVTVPEREDRMAAVELDAQDLAVTALCVLRDRGGAGKAAVPMVTHSQEE